MGLLIVDMLPIVTFAAGIAVLYFHSILLVLVVNERYWQV